MENDNLVAEAFFLGGEPFDEFALEGFFGLADGGGDVGECR